MKRFIVLLCALLILVSCAAFTQNTYRTLFTAGTTYDAAMTTVATLQGQGIISPEQRAEINRLGNIFYVAYQGSVDAFELYKKTGMAEDKNKVTVALNGIALKWKELAAYINRIKPGSVPITLEEK